MGARYAKGIGKLDLMHCWSIAPPLRASRVREAHPLPACAGPLKGAKPADWQSQIRGFLGVSGAYANYFISLRLFHSVTLGRHI